MYASLVSMWPRIWTYSLRARSKPPGGGLAIVSLHPRVHETNAAAWWPPPIPPSPRPQSLAGHSLSCSASSLLSSSLVLRQSHLLSIIAACPCSNYCSLRVFWKDAFFPTCGAPSSLWTPFLSALLTRALLGQPIHGQPKQHICGS